MELKRALTGQFRAGLAMLRECVQRCPDGLWGEIIDKPPRAFWRIVYHTAFYTHFYLLQSQSEFQEWDRHVSHAMMTFAEDGAVIPPSEPVYSQSDLLDYIDFLSAGMETRIEELDLETLDCGFPWYQDFPKLDHVLLTLRHLGVHVGQLQELLFERGIDPDWVSRQ